MGIAEDFEADIEGTTPGLAEPDEGPPPVIEIEDDSDDGPEDEDEEEPESEEPERKSRKERRKDRYLQRELQKQQIENARLAGEMAALQRLQQPRQAPPQRERDDSAEFDRQMAEIQSAVDKMQSDLDMIWSNPNVKQEDKHAKFKEFNSRVALLNDRRVQLRSERAAAAAVARALANQPAPIDPYVEVTKTRAREQNPDIFGDDRKERLLDSVMNMLVLSGEPDTAETYQKAINETRSRLKLPALRGKPSRAARASTGGSPAGGGGYSSGGDRDSAVVRTNAVELAMAKQSFPGMSAAKAVRKFRELPEGIKKPAPKAKRK